MLVYPDGQLRGDRRRRRFGEPGDPVGAAGAPGWTSRACLEYAFHDLEQGDVGVCGGEMEVFVEPIQPPATVVVVGAGHVGSAVAFLASGWDSGWWYPTTARSSPRRRPCRTPMNRLRAAVRSAAAGADYGADLHHADHPRRGGGPGGTAVPLGNPGRATSECIGSRRRWETAAQQLAEQGRPTGADRTGHLAHGAGVERRDPAGDRPEHAGPDCPAAPRGHGEVMAHAPAAPRRKGKSTAQVPKRRKRAG